MKSLVLKRPIRSFRTALFYWYLKRITISHNPAIYAWLWWNW
jgi:hypothetical protein